MATPIFVENIGKHPNSINRRFKVGHKVLAGSEKGYFKKGTQNNPSGGFSKNHIPWNKGKKHLNKEKHWNWKGGITPENIKLRNSIQGKLWREAVFKRDNFTCQECGQHGGKLNAHHIKTWAKHPEFRFDISNGTTLCINCHKTKGTYAGKL